MSSAEASAAAAVTAAVAAAATVPAVAVCAAAVATVGAAVSVTSRGLWDIHSLQKNRLSFFLFCFFPIASNCGWGVERGTMTFYKLFLIAVSNLVSNLSRSRR